MARVRVHHDIRLEYITSELPWSCIRGQQLGVEVKIVDGGSPASCSLSSCEGMWFTEWPHAEVAMVEMRFITCQGGRLTLVRAVLDGVGPVWISDKTRWTRDEEGEF